MISALQRVFVVALAVGVSVVCGREITSMDEKLTIFNNLSQKDRDQVKNPENICLYTAFGPTFMGIKEQVAYRYETLEKISEGAYGEVFKAKDYCTGELIALKIFRNRDQDDILDFTLDSPQGLKFPEYVKEGWREYNIAGSDLVAGNPHCVHALNAYEFSDYFAITYPLFDTSLSSYNKNFLSTLDCDDAYRLIKSVTRQILQCLKHIHDRGLVHNDLKPGNVLISGDPYNPFVAVTDFGISCYTQDCEWKRVTPWYEAPEIIQYGRGNVQSDIWSLGVIVAELFRTKPVFSIKLNDLSHLYAVACLSNDFLMKGRIGNQLRVPPQKRMQFAQAYGVDPIGYMQRGLDRVLYRKEAQLCHDQLYEQMHAFVEGCLKFQPQLRLNAQAALENPFLDF
ncbi:hypothetical protein MIR68_004532 [Amoeboaphelidium protococcarum]|nr:hypothetical protein MIR68_004532 [Amoeboaphelidium protococcarum]